MKEFKMNPIVQKIAGIASAIVMGIVAVANALAEQKREREHEDMKKTLSELQEKIK